MMQFGLAATLCAAIAAVVPAIAVEKSERKLGKQETRPTIVLVHGAWADGTGWQHVIPLLERDGFLVIAVQNPLTSLADDVSATRRVLKAQKGEVVAVGHSYGGAVITAAAAGLANVKSLVYVAAFAPDSGESLGSLGSKYPPTPTVSAVAPDAAGFLYIDRAKFHAVFCADVPDEEARVMAAAQKPFAAANFAATVETPAWKTIPSWYLVAKDDQAIHPDLQRFMAKRMNAKTTEVRASHVPYVSQPKVVVDMIKEAAKSSAH
jgi:pimeloyl-ACP methyl ester carboxylesterase